MSHVSPQPVLNSKNENGSSSRSSSNRERREEELRDAYRRARSPEEASAILQRYAQRFSISEAVLERLQLPKLLDRSVSADPSLPGSPFPLSLSLTASPTTPDPFDEDPDGPLRFLRQQSAPPPKFTSTLEARIEEFPREAPQQRPQIRSRSSEPPASRGLSSKPLLMPKPFLQSRPSPPEHWSNKVRPSSTNTNLIVTQLELIQLHLNPKLNWSSSVAACRQTPLVQFVDI